MHSRAVSHPVELMRGVPMQRSVGKPFSVLTLSMPTRIFLATVETAVLVPQHTYVNIVVSTELSVSKLMNT